MTMPVATPHATSVNLKVDMPAILTTLSALSGVAGIVCGTLGVASMTPAIQAVITSIGGLLVAISGYHATSVVAATAAVNRGANVKVGP